MILVVICQARMVFMDYLIRKAVQSCGGIGYGRSLAFSWGVSWRLTIRLLVRCIQVLIQFLRLSKFKGFRLNKIKWRFPLTSMISSIYSPAHPFFNQRD